MEHNIKIVICTERGILEKYSVLLCRSLRQFGGEMSQTEIYSIAPRKGYYPSKKTISELEKLRVKHLNIDLNIRYRDYPLANKPFVCEHFENEFENSTLIFIDSDQLILNEPKEFLILEPEIKLRMVDLKGIGISNQNDIESDYWTQVFSELNVDYTKFSNLETSCGDLIFPYFNSGLIISKSTNGVFKKWRQNLEKIIGDDIIPKNGAFFLEQSVFSATVLQINLPFKLVDNAYNYPFSLHDKISPKFKMDDFSKIVTAHYHDLLVTKPYPKFFVDFLNRTEKGQWLKAQINDLAIKPPCYLRQIYDKMKRKLRKFFF